MKSLARLAVLLMVGTLPVRAEAVSTLVFDFNTLDGDSNSKVQNYMQGIINTAAIPGGKVTVTGAKGEKDYTGDKHAVGPKVQALVNGKPVTKVRAETLGTSDHGVHHDGAFEIGS